MSEVERPSSLPHETWVSIRAHTRLLATGVALLVLANLLGLVAVTLGPEGTGELRFDITLAQHRGAFAADAAKGIHIALGMTVAPIIVLVVCALLWRWRRSAALMVIILTVVGWGSVIVGKAAFRRERPPTGVVHALVVETGADSFPSGHTAFAAALVCALLVVLHRSGRGVGWAAVGGVVVVAVVAMSRLVAGAHFYLDVLAAPMFAAGSILVLCVIGQAGWGRVEARLDGEEKSPVMVGPGG